MYPERSEGSHKAQFIFLRFLTKSCAIRSLLLLVCPLGTLCHFQLPENREEREQIVFSGETGINQAKLATETHNTAERDRETEREREREREGGTKGGKGQLGAKISPNTVATSFFFIETCTFAESAIK